MVFTGSRCHLTTPDADATLARARSLGVRGFVVPGTKLDDAAAVIAVATRHDDVWAAVGFHPHEAKGCGDEAFAEIERLGEDERGVAIGGGGAGSRYMPAPRETQIAVLERPLDLAKRLAKPIIIHNRESTEDMVRML